MRAFFRLVDGQPLAVFSYGLSSVPVERRDGRERMLSGVSYKGTKPGPHPHELV